MKAYQINKYGEYEPLVMNEISKPKIQKDKIIVRVHAASINPVDYKIRKGTAKVILRYKMPLTLGHDFSGIIESVGSEIHEFSVGDKVYGRIPISGSPDDTPGSFQEFVLVGENDIAKIPSNLTLTEAAAVPLVALTAYQGLFDWIQLQKKQSILITGGAGGVGHVAIQLALMVQAKVYTTASKDGTRFLKDFGDIEFIDYKTEKFYEVLSDVDAVLDMQGGDDLRLSFNIVKKGGKIATINYLPTPSYAVASGRGKLTQFFLKVATYSMRKKAQKHKVSFHSFLTLSNRKELEVISKFIEEEQLKVIIQKVYSDKEINTAVEKVMNGRVKGKIVVKFDW
ncbi:NADP-dependent oxidoreductase [Lysinibacillus fusiformis]|uniref:NADP-dependent oxidoreductase n=1 Tax=Lysinibacillus sp. PWR01 TaxID=3342384 RepID=UPI00372D03A9